MAKTTSEDTVKSSEVIEDILEIATADIQQRFQFFETYKEPEKERKQFRITPPRDPSQVKVNVLRCLGMLNEGFQLFFPYNNILVWIPKWLFKKQ